MPQNKLINCLRLLVMAGALSLFFSSCSYKQNQVFLEHKKGTNPDLADYAGYTSVYKIKPQDVLQIRNLQNIKYIVDDVPTGATSGPANSGGGSQGQNYEVAEDGAVALPVIGRVPVKGLSRLEAAKKIQDLYAKNLIKNPIIDVKIINLKITILGEVRAPGNYPLVKDETNLIEMLGEAGGITDRGDERRVKIVRGGTHNPQITEIDLSDVATLTNPSIIMQNSDIVYVNENKRALRNEKLTNFTTLMQPALILLNSALIIFTLRR